MHIRFRPAMTAAAFVAGIAAPAAYAQLIPNPADIATVGVGSIVSPRAGDGQTLIGANIGQTVHQEGSTATATLLGPNSVADVNFSNVTTPERTQIADIAGVTAGPVAVTRPNDGGSAATLSIASAAPPQGSTASIGVASAGGPATLGLPGWTGLPGLSRLPFTLPKLGGR